MANTKEQTLKIVDMTNIAEVVKYDEDVSKLIDDYNSKIKEAKDNAELSDVAFFDMGKRLIEVQKKIQGDNQEPVKAKKIFAAFKLRVSEKISKDISNVDKVFKVAEFCETDTYKKHQDRLPSGWGTLYLLLSFKKEKDGKKELDTKKIDKLMSDTEITKDIKRSELIEKINVLKNPKKVIKKEIVITIEGEVKLTAEELQQQLQELQKHLDEKFNQWKITTPKIKSKKATNTSGATDNSENGKTE